MSSSSYPPIDVDALERAYNEEPDDFMYVRDLIPQVIRELRANRKLIKRLQEIADITDAEVDALK